MARGDVEDVGGELTDEIPEVGCFTRQELYDRKIFW